MSRIIKIKNLQDVADTYCGQEIGSLSYYQLEDTEFTKWATDQKVLNHLTSDPAKILVNNGTSDLAWSLGKQHLEGSAPVNIDGIPIVTSPLMNLDKRPIQHSTPRKFGTYSVFSSVADNQDSPSEIFHGDHLEIVHNIGDNTEQIAYFDVNTVQNETWIHDAFLQWEGAKRDCVECEIVTKSSSAAIGTGTNTFYEVVSGILVMAPGNGTKTVTDWDLVNPVEMVYNEHGIKPSGYWDADYNTSTKKFENYTFCADGSGRYNIFVSEIELNCFIPGFLLLGNGSHELGSHDISQLGHNMRIKAIANTRGEDHAWSFCASIYLYRAKTC